MCCLYILGVWIVRKETPYVAGRWARGMKDIVHRFYKGMFTSHPNNPMKVK